MSNAMQFELSCPQRQVCAKTAAMVTVPGADGAFGVLLGHAPMAAQIGAGVLEVYEAEGGAVTDRWFVAGGFCDVTTQSCTVMADEILALKDLDRDALEAEIKSLSDIALSDDEAAGKLAIAQAKLLAAA